MAIQTIGLGAAPNDGTGSDLRTAGDLINDNFVELYAADALFQVMYAAVGTGVPLSLATTPGGALVPGIYVVDTTSGAFACTLQASQRGTWTFIDATGTTATNALTIGTSGETYNGVAGGVTFDSGVGRVVITNHAGSTAYVLEVY